MDIQRIKKAVPLWKKYWYVPLIALAFFAALQLKNYMGDASFIVNEQKLVMATVEQGDFIVNVRATGVLKPTDVRWVSSQVSGRVEQTYVKAGAYVSKGDVLATLSNPQLHRALETAIWEYDAKKAENNAALVTLESQLVDLTNAVVQAHFDFQSSQLKLQAQTQLVEQMNGTITELSYQQSQLAEKQQRHHWESQKQKIEKMQAKLVASKAAQQARLGLLKNDIQRTQEKIAALDIIAPAAGVIQQVSLALGEQINIGASVATIADHQNLYAELLVQEINIRDVRIGQSVSIDTRASVISGEVSRIDPIVQGGMVQIDIHLTGALPSEARPDLTVDGLIEINHIADALFVRRPAFAPKFSEVGLYRLSTDQKFAKKHQVKLGQSSVSQIEILAGLKLGDVVVISDTTTWQEHQQVMIN